MAHQAFSAATMPGRGSGRRRGELPSARQALWLAGLCLIALALGAGCAMLRREWHMPSDVLGGYLMAGLWTALAVAAVRFSERREPSRALPASTAARRAGLRAPGR